MLAFLPLALLAKANTGKTGAPILQGYVTDAVTKKPVPGVVVSASTPGSSGVSEAVTDACGYFHFGQLRSVQVNLQFDKKGYVPYKRSGVAIKEKSSVRLNVEFAPDGYQNDVDDSEYPLLRRLEEI
jgi:hypothetical protein